MSKVITQIILFILVTFVLCAFFVHFQINIFVSLALSILLQYAGFGVYKNIVEIVSLKKIKEIELQKAKEYTYQHAEVTCPCSYDAKQIVPIRLNTPNQYKCNKCGKNVSIYVTIETALTTEPILAIDQEAVNNLLLSKINEFTTKY